MTDRELLERAARAAGIFDQLFWSDIYQTYYWVDRYDSGIDGDQPGARWNPLEDDGDALRLAAKLVIAITFYPGSQLVTAKTVDAWVPCTIEKSESYRDDSLAATRRAIVRVAAELAPCE